MAQLVYKHVASCPVLFWPLGLVPNSAFWPTVVINLPCNNGPGQLDLDRHTKTELLLPVSSVSCTQSQNAYVARECCSTYSMALRFTSSTAAAFPCVCSYSSQRLKKNFIFLGGNDRLVARSKRERTREGSPCLISCSNTSTTLWITQLLWPQQTCKTDRMLNYRLSHPDPYTCSLCTLCITTIDMPTSLRSLDCSAAHGSSTILKQ